MTLLILLLVAGILVTAVGFYKQMRHRREKERSRKMRGFIKEIKADLTIPGGGGVMKTSRLLERLIDRGIGSDEEGAENIMNRLIQEGRLKPYGEHEDLWYVP